jgi:hypothetical protein
MIDKPKSVFQQKLKENLKTKTSKTLVHDIIKLHLFKNADKDDDQLALVDLYNYLGTDKFIEFMGEFQGSKINVPTKDDFKDTLIISLCYYYREIEGRSWDEVKSLLNLPDLSSVKYGVKLGQLSDFIKKQLVILSKKDTGND